MDKACHRHLLVVKRRSYKVALVFLYFFNTQMHDFDLIIIQTKMICSVIFLLLPPNFLLDTIFQFLTFLFIRNPYRTISELIGD